MIGEKREDVTVSAQDVFGKTLQSLLRSHFYEDSGSGSVEGAQSLNKLNRRSDLLAEEVENLRQCVRPRRIELAGDIRYYRHVGRLQPQALHHPTQRFAGLSNDRGMERVA